MENYKFTGKITKVLDVKQGQSAKGEWATVSFVAEELNPEKPQYPQRGVFSLMKSGEYIKYATNFAKDYPVGTAVEVEFNLKANEYKDKWYGDLSAWKVTKLEGAGTAAPAVKDDFEDIF